MASMPLRWILGFEGFPRFLLPRGGGHLQTAAGASFPALWLPRARLPLGRERSRPIADVSGRLMAILSAPLSLSQRGIV